MAQNDQEKLRELQEKLEFLSVKHHTLSRELETLRREIHSQQIQSPEIKKINPEGFPPVESKPIAVSTPTAVSAVSETPKKIAPVFTVPKPAVKSDFEKFIGENLLNKIGIVITVIGVGIGAKYAIDHQLISPLARILLGYLIGIGLLGFALKLKKNYESFSAVLLSGAMAIMYLLTFAAYNFYELIPIVPTFVLMLLFTVFTVIASLNYNKVVIAQIGFVGAYAIPFLLSTGAGNFIFLFSYMTIINSGILVLAYRKYWRSLYVSSFCFTWFIYCAWYAGGYENAKHFALAIIFLSIFYISFYLTFIIHKLSKKEQFHRFDIVLLLTNSFIAYLLGYSLIDGQPSGSFFLGIYTLIHAIIHFTVSVVIYRNKLADRNLFYLVGGLVLTFITITIPVQLDGGWVSLLWSAEAALLFWIGRTRKTGVYEGLSYVLMILAFFSLAQDWSMMITGYFPGNDGAKITPVFNIGCMISLMVFICFLIINIIHNKNPEQAEELKKYRIISLFNYILPSLAGIILYNTFRLQIAGYFDQLFFDSEIVIKKSGNPPYDYNQYNEGISLFGFLWSLMYTVFFLIVMAEVNLRKTKNTILAYVNMGLMSLCLFTILTAGLYDLSLLRDLYINQTLSNYYPRGISYILIRYFVLAFAIAIIFTFYRYLRSGILKINFSKAFDAVLYISILWLSSSELIHWMDLGRSGSSHKLALSILWGIYALIVVMIGIKKHTKYLRLGAIGLFAITLIKLFFYDISHLDTIAKTIVFVSLGVLLLVISFLYNKNKNILFGADDEK